MPPGNTVWSDWYDTCYILEDMKSHTFSLLFSHRLETWNYTLQSPIVIAYFFCQNVKSYALASSTTIVTPPQTPSISIHCIQFDCKKASTLSGCIGSSMIIVGRLHFCGGIDQIVILIILVCRINLIRFVIGLPMILSTGKPSFAKYCIFIVGIERIKMGYCFQCIVLSFLCNQKKDGLPSLSLYLIS